jgi:hypothetical protein
MQREQQQFGAPMLNPSVNGNGSVEIAVRNVPQESHPLEEILAPVGAKNSNFAQLKCSAIATGERPNIGHDLYQ